MIRKQLNITDAQERALKARARETGVSEAEVVRELLDRLLTGNGEALASSGRARAALAFLNWAEETSSSHSLEEGYVFDREELHEDRGYTSRSARSG